MAIAKGTCVSFSLWHILASPGYAPETIAVNWYFFLPLAFNAPVGVFPLDRWNSGKKFGPQKTRIIGLPGSEDRLTIG